MFLWWSTLLKPRSGLKNFTCAVSNRWLPFLFKTQAQLPYFSAALEVMFYSLNFVDTLSYVNEIKAYISYSHYSMSFCQVHRVWLHTL